MKNIKILFCCLFLVLVCQVATAQQDDKLSIYPNPFNMKGENYNIYNSSGSLVKFGKLKNNGMDISMLPSGEYILEVSSYNKKTTKSFFKQ